MTTGQKVIVGIVVLFVAAGTLQTLTGGQTFAFGPMDVAVFAFFAVIAVLLYRRAGRHER